MAYTNKTQPTNISPEQYLRENFKEKKILQSDTQTLINIYTQATGSSCVMWNKIFGFGKYHYRDSTGGSHTYLITGFAISSSGFTLYNMMGWETYTNDIAQLGKYKLTGKSCLSIKSVTDIDHTVLKDVIQQSLTDMKKKYTTEI
jgi:hypothetical protein